MTQKPASATQPILVFDSGIGGLTVLREARAMMPDRCFVYVADDAGFPYGRWEESGLKARILTLFRDLIIKHNPKIVIIACNTASTLVLHDLRSAYPLVPFVGTVPAIKPAAERTHSGFISVLATPGTIARAYTHDLIQSFAAQCHIRLVGSENLAHIAETYVRGDDVDDAVIRAEIAPCFVTKNCHRTDIVVLACTHYPFLINIFRRLAPWPVDWIDSAEAIAKRARLLLIDSTSGAEPKYGDDIAVFTSGKPDFLTQRLMQGFGLTICNCEL